MNNYCPFRPLEQWPGTPATQNRAMTKRDVVRCIGDERDRPRLETIINPPVHAWACWRVYKMTAPRGERDWRFLSSTFQKLFINFTWWVNRKDARGKHLFSGGFLGLDNIGVFDRSRPLPCGGHLEQADGTAWMACYLPLTPHEVAG